MKNKKQIENDKCIEINDKNCLKRILVTGGAGFLGMHLCSKLLSMGHEVICMDNLFTSEKNRIYPLLDKYPSKFEFIRHDITIPYICEVDEIYNLACPASPVHYQYNPIKTTKTSFLGAMNMLGLAKRLGKKCKIFQASTSEIYGDPSISPQKEDYFGYVNCIGVRSCYDEGKRVAETLFFDYHRQHNISIRVARIFNTYGPGMHPNDGRVISNFIMQALNNENITIYGDGTQTRSFCYVDDMIYGIVSFMENEHEFIGPMNLGNTVEITIIDLANKILKLVKDTTSKIIFLPLPGNDPRKRKPCVDVAEKYIHWKPKVEIDEGLKKTIDYFKNLDTKKYRKLTCHSAYENTAQWEKIQEMHSICNCHSSSPS